MKSEKIYSVIDVCIVLLKKKKKKQQEIKAGHDNVVVLHPAAAFW